MVYKYGELLLKLLKSQARVEEMYSYTLSSAGLDKIKKKGRLAENFPGEYSL